MIAAQDIMRLFLRRKTPIPTGTFLHDLRPFSQIFRPWHKGSKTRWRHDAPTSVGPMRAPKPNEAPVNNQNVTTRAYGGRTDLALESSRM